MFIDDAIAKALAFMVAAILMILVGIQINSAIVVLANITNGIMVR